MIWETVRLALLALRRNKLRSALTMLGIVIGVAAVIAMVTVGQGSSRSVTASVESLGTNVLSLRPGRGGFGPGGSSQTTRPFTLRDADALADLPVIRPVLDKEFAKLMRHLAAGGDVVIPADGLGTGLSQLPDRAPAVLEYIETTIDALVEFSDE